MSPIRVDAPSIKLGKDVNKFKNQPKTNIRRAFVTAGFQNSDGRLTLLSVGYMNRGNCLAI